jgi:hypothetical protein
VAGTTTVIRSAFRDRSTLAWDDSSGCSTTIPDSEGDVTVVRCAGLCLIAGISGQQLRPTHVSSVNVGCDFTFSAIAVPVPTIMASATTQPAIIFMAQSSWAATLESSLAKSCDRDHKNALYTTGERTGCPARQTLSCYRKASGTSASRQKAFL